MKRQRRSVDAKIKSDGAGDHHQDQKTLGRQCRDVRPHENAHEQPAGSPGHRKPEAFQNVSRFPHAEAHRGNPRDYRRAMLGRFPLARHRREPAKAQRERTGICFGRQLTRGVQARGFCHEVRIDSIRPCRWASGLVGPDVCRPDNIARRAAFFASKWGAGSRARGRPVSRPGGLFFPRPMNLGGPTET
jgi:hypothetical protein